MKTHRGIALALFALAAVLPLTFLSGTTALAQQAAGTAAAARIDGFDVKPVKQLTAGNELAFTLYGSPGGNAVVQVGGATSSLNLAEIEAGVYEGTYTINRRDRLTAQSTATANLRLGNRVASSVLDDSLIAGAPARWTSGAAPSGRPPRIDQFDVDSVERLHPGAELAFTLKGSPGGNASFRINGVPGKLALEEVSAGVYEGAYVVKRRDRIDANSVVTGNLRLGKLERSKVLGQALAENSPSRPRMRGRPEGNRTGAVGQVPAHSCPNCGVVEAVHVVEHSGDGSLIGKIGGGVVGGLLGSQVGHGSGKTIATVIGAAGGAFAGNEIEKRVKKTKHFEVVVRLENGGTQMVSYPAEPGLPVGTRVRVENGTLVRS